MNGIDKTLSLRGGRLVLPDGVVEGKSVLIQRGLIARLADDERSTNSGQVLDVDGLTLFPGFIDVHIHGAVGVDTMEASVKGLAQVSEFLATRGVTGWLPTLVPAPATDYQRAITVISEAMNTQVTGQSATETARILGVHYEGPFVNLAQCGALRSQFFRTFSSAADLDGLPIVQRDSARHMITVAPEIDGGIDLVRELNARDWTISVGHTRASFDLLEEAAAAGAHHLTHFMNAMAPLHHRAPGPVGWGLSRNDVTCDIIADGIHLNARTLQLLLKLKGSDRLALISDAVAPAGKGDGDYEIWGETISVKDGRTSNARGSIAGSVITMLDAVRLMQSLGATEVDLARMAAGNPARLLKIEHECGSIEEGKRADLVALDEQGNVRLTVVAGRVVFEG